jgi:hypothetical protein
MLMVLLFNSSLLCASSLLGDLLGGFLSGDLLGGFLGSGLLGSGLPDSLGSGLPDGLGGGLLGSGFPCGFLSSDSGYGKE